MTRRWLVPAAFAALCLVQAAVPVSMIARYERTLHGGTAFKVRAAPVDPVDPFRGRYVVFRLGFEPVSLETSFAGPVWVELEEGADGFAKAGKVSKTRAGRRALRASPGDPARVGRRGRPDPPPAAARPLLHGRIEGPARGGPHPRPESAGATRSTWVTLRVRDGVAAVEHLWIDGVTVEEHLRRTTTP